MSYKRKLAVLQNWRIIGRLPSSYPRVMHSSISVQLLKGNFLLLLMVQLISLMSIPKDEVHPFIASIQIFSVRTTGKNWRECCLKLDVSVDENWPHSILIPTRVHKLFISCSCVSAHAIRSHCVYCLYIAWRATVTATTKMQRQQHMSASSPHELHFALCVVFDDDNTRYVDNKPLCASARSLNFGNDGKESWQRGPRAQAHNTWA